MKNKMDEKIAIECDCGEEVLVVADDYPCGFNLGMFNRYCTKNTWRNRLRLIWRIIRTGSPYTDQICISYDNVCELMDFFIYWEKEHKNA